MHEALVKSEPVANGVRITVTSDQAELAQAIKEEFGTDPQDFKSTLPETEVAVQALDNGAAFTFTSKDAATVQELQSRGSGLFYTVQMETMHQSMPAQGGFRGQGHGGMHGRDMRGGWYGERHHGYGPRGGGRHQ